MQARRANPTRWSKCWAGAPPALGETEVRIVPGDYDTLAGVHEPPIPGMHVSPAYRYYPGQARGDEPEGCIVFLRRYRRGKGGLRVGGAGAREPVSKRAEIPRCWRGAACSPRVVRGQRGAATVAVGAAVSAG